MKMKQILLLLFISSTILTRAQIYFVDDSFGNGMKIPKAVYESEPEIAKKVNISIRDFLAEYEAMDLCMSDYGFVQKDKFIQLQIYLLCDEFDDSRYLYLMFSTETGEKATQEDMINPKFKEDFHKFLNEKIKQHIEQNNIVFENEDEKRKLENMKFNDFTVILKREGFEITSEGHFIVPLKLTWKEVSLYLKPNYL